MMKNLGLVCLLVLGSGCMAQDGATLSLENAIAPDNQCLFSATSTSFLGYGLFDPHGYGGAAPRDYVLFARMQNRAFATTDDPGNLLSPGGSPINIRPDANDITVFGFETCWDLADNHVADNGALDCSKLPADQRAFLPASSTVEVASRADVAVQVLTVDHMRAANLFGPAFDPVNIPEVAKQGPIQVGPTAFSLPLLHNASESPRDPAWGWGNFPADPYNTARVIVALRGHGHNMAGGDINSNWFYFPIDVIPGYLATACGVPEWKPLCGADHLNQYVGDFLNLGPSACLPGDGGLTISCNPVATCSGAL
jgi:hypothetical protein